jgi:hypothetical protein
VSFTPWELLSAGTPHKKEINASQSLPADEWLEKLEAARAFRISHGGHWPLRVASDEKEQSLGTILNNAQRDHTATEVRSRSGSNLHGSFLREASSKMNSAWRWKPISLPCFTYTIACHKKKTAKAETEKTLALWIMNHSSRSQKLSDGQQQALTFLKNHFSTYSKQPVCSTSSASRPAATLRSRRQLSSQCSESGTP